MLIERGETRESDDEEDDGFLESHVCDVLLMQDKAPSESEYL
jgi:hypothetical protein